MRAKRVYTNTLKLADAEARTPAVSGVEAMRQQLQLALFGAVTEKDVVGMAELLKQKALDGDLPAMKLFFGLVLGPAQTTVQQAVVVRPDGEPERLPAAPTRERPQSRGKLEVIAARVERGESAFHPEDGPEVDLS
jgi:hypothetical protein